jgi:hypothetical protein
MGEYVGEGVGHMVSVPVGFVASLAAAAGRGVDAGVTAGASVEVSEGAGVAVEFATRVGIVADTDAPLTVGTPIEISSGVNVRGAAMGVASFDGAHAAMDRRSKHAAIRTPEVRFPVNPFPPGCVQPSSAGFEPGYPGRRPCCWQPGAGFA